MRATQRATRIGMIELVAVPYSPWSEKARWALDHHALPYRETAYQPLIG
jgi:glutathione S-transferase